MVILQTTMRRHKKKAVMRKPTTDSPNPAVVCCSAIWDYRLQYDKSGDIFLVHLSLIKLKLEDVDHPALFNKDEYIMRFMEVYIWCNGSIMFL